VNRGFALTIGLLVMLAPAVARAQTNLDQGKSASQLFAGACADCHKAPHTLAKGKSAATVAEFLREHYTTGRDQAAALAAYVVSGRDTVASPGPGGRRPAAVASPPKPVATPDDRPSANAKPRRPSDEATTGGSVVNPIVRSEPPAHDNKAATTRNRRKEPGDVGQEPAAAAVRAPSEAMPEVARPEPANQEPPTATVSAPSAPAPAAVEPAPAEAPAAESGETAPRDNIPD
jgi:hypothetical protein